MSALDILALGMAADLRDRPFADTGVYNWNPAYLRRAAKALADVRSGKARAVVPTGTTGDVVPTFSGSVNSCSIAVYRVMNRPSASAATDSGSATISGATTVGISGIDVNVGGFVLSVVGWGNTVSAPALSGLTGAASDVLTTSESTGYAAHGSTPLQAGASTGNTLTWTWTTSRSGLAAAWAF